MFIANLGGQHGNKP